MDAPSSNGIAMCQTGVVKSPIGVDLAKHVFQLHGAAADGTMVFRKAFRSQFRQLMSDRSCCVVAMEACATSHYWAREFTKMGHEVRLIAPQGIGNLPRLPEIINDPCNDLPELARDLANLHLNRIDALTILIEQMMQKIRQVSRESGTARTLQTMPGVGPICAMAVEAFAPAMDTFKSGRDFSAWLELIHGNTRRAGKSDWDEHRRWGSATFVSY